MIIEHSLKKSLDELIEESCESLRVPGMALMVAQGDDVIYEYFYGYRDVQAKKPVTQDTIFGVASLTKSFAALGIMQLEDAKKLSVDDPIVHWLPEFKTP